MTTLYSDGFWISPYVFNCFVALREKEIPFDVKELRLDAAEQRQGSYTQESWTGRVPSLVHDGFWLTESIAILEYLDDSFPHTTPLLPKSLQDRARARQLLAWLRSDETLPVRSERSSEGSFYDRPRPVLTEKATSTAAKVVELASRFVKNDVGPMFGTWCIADADLAFFLHRLWHDDVLTTGLRAYAEAQWKRPSIAEWVAHERRPYVSYAW